MIKTMSICSRKRITYPNGSWRYEELVGGKVHIKSTPISNFFGSYAASDTYVIEDILFQISIDGKAITVLKLQGIEDKFFTLKDVEVIEVGRENIYDAICGTFVCSESITGRNVSHEPTWLEDIRNGIAIIDSEGNTVVNGYVMIDQSIIEENADKTVSTIKFKSNIL